MEASAKQATVGKLLLGMRVVDREGRRITFKKATTRHFAKILSVLTLGVGFLMILSKSRQAFHDVLSGTLIADSNAVFTIEEVAVAYPQAPKAWKRSMWGLASLTLAFICITSASILQRELPNRQYAVNVSRPFHEAYVRKDYKTAERILLDGIIEAEAQGQVSLYVGTILHLADFYELQKKYTEAEAQYKRAIATLENKFPADNLGRVQILEELAKNYEKQGKYAEAEQRYERAMAIREKTLGPDNPKLVFWLAPFPGCGGLAQLYIKQGKYAKAERLYKRVLAMREKAGDFDPKVAWSLDDLAAVYKSQAKFAEAEPLLKRAIAIYQRVSGPNTPDEAFALDKLAALYEDQGKYAEAELLYKRSLAIYEQTYPGSLSSTRSLNGLAVIYDRQGKHAVAEPLYKRALAIWVLELLGKQGYVRVEPGAEAILANYSQLLRNTNRGPQAAKLKARITAIMESAQKEPILTMF
jgi:tetratricopeptide (TPR) repeat protein